MKEFNLKAALAGEPVFLRSGRKAFVLCDLKQYFKNPISDKHLIGITSLENDSNSFEHSLRWHDSGAYSVTEDECDIIGMWEEPKISIEDLPKPFIPIKTQEYWVISPDYDKPLKFHAMNLNHSSILNSNCFRTKADAQKWIDFMKSMVE